MCRMCHSQQLVTNPHFKLRGVYQSFAYKIFKYITYHISHVQIIIYHISYSHIITYNIYIYTLWLFNIAMDNCPFIDHFPSWKPPSIYGIFHGELLVITRWYIYFSCIPLLQLWPEIPIISTELTPFIECIIPVMTSYN